MATTALVVRTLSLCNTCCYILSGIMFGMLGVIFIIILGKRDKADGQARVGLALSIIGITITVLVIVVFVAIEVLAVIPKLN